MKEAVIQLTNVSKSFQRASVQAVKNLSLTVSRGEIFGLLGPNGAGKTTTLKLIAGILKPDAGSIHIAGISLAQEAERVKKIIGYAASEPLLYENMTGNEFLCFIASMYKLPKEANRTIEELGEQFGVREMYPETIAAYPFGFKQKLSLVALFLHDPRILILDEPFGGLDPRSCAVLGEKLNDFAAKGRTVVLSTYFMDIAEKICRRAGIMNRGSLVAAGSLAALKKNSSIRRPSLEQVFLELTG